MESDSEQEKRKRTLWLKSAMPFLKDPMHFWSLSISSVLNSLDLHLSWSSSWFHLVNIATLKELWQRFHFYVALLPHVVVDSLAWKWQHFVTFDTTTKWTNLGKLCSRIWTGRILCSIVWTSWRWNFYKSGRYWCWFGRKNRLRHTWRWPKKPCDNCW